MRDKRVHNPKICLELRAIQWPPFDPVTIYWPLGVDIDHIEYHWFKVSSKRIDCRTLLSNNNALSKIPERKVLDKLFMSLIKSDSFLDWVGKHIVQ